MSTQIKFGVLPIALIMMGSLAMAQSQPQAQGAGSSATPNTAQSGQLTAVGNLSKDGPIYGDSKPDSDPAMFIATTGVNQAIDGLSRAFANKDLVAFKQIWPSIPEKPYAALGKSLGYFKSVSRNFKAERIDVNGDTATVVGSYSGSFINGATIIPSNGGFHATLTRIGTRWVVLTLDCK